MNFDNLYARALGEWPKEIRFGRLRHHNLSTQTYSTRELFLLCEKIIAPHLNSPDEILMANLHDAIYIVLHDVAGHCTSIKLEQLRKESVRSKFEERLSPDRITKELSWTDDDRKLVKKYFKEVRKAKSKKAAKRQ